MSDLMITDGVKQTVITRLSTINAAISLLNLTHGKPAKGTVDDILSLAEQLEQWAWRDLLDGNTDTPAPGKPADPVPLAPPAQTSAEPPRPNPAPPQREPRLNGDGQRTAEASVKQINALFAIGRSKGYDSNGVKAWVKKRCGKNVNGLTSREASTLIDDLKAL